MCVCLWMLTHLAVVCVQGSAGEKGSAGNPGTAGQKVRAFGGSDFVQLVTQL